MKKILIVSPVFNESKIINDNASRVLEWCEQNLRNYDWKFVIVDNASTDFTSISNKLTNKYFDRFEYQRTEKKGRGYALKWIWKKEDFDFSIYMDIDLSTDLAAIHDILPRLEQGTDLVVGSRWMKASNVVNRQLKRTVVSFSYKTLVQFLTGSKISDFQCGFKGVRSDFIKQIIPELKNNEWFFDTELVLTAENQRYNIEEIPVKWTDRPESTVRLVRDSVEMLGNLIKFLIRNRT